VGLENVSGQGYEKKGVIRIHTGQKLLPGEEGKCSEKRTIPNCQYWGFGKVLSS